MLNIPLNRVEGDLEVSAEIENGMVSDARCSGVMYRGFEKMLLGRGAMDGLVLTPRICGICTTAHLTAASSALDMIAGITLPPDAVRIRNLALMTEYIQSDMRHGILMFAADFANPVFKKCKLYEEAVQRYEPLKGSAVIEVIRETRRVLGIIAIIGGQWPHSTYMVPGGIASIPSLADLLQCRLLLKQYRNWYEQKILGCSIERWNEVKTVRELDIWLAENRAHQNSEIGFYIRFARDIGLDKIGKGHGNFISFGGLDMPHDTKVEIPKDRTSFIPAGFFRSGNTETSPEKYAAIRRFIPSGFFKTGQTGQPDTRLEEFDQEKIAEHVAFSWFKDYEGGLHPFKGETKPYATGREGAKYSWAKAPRYNGFPAETGPLAEMLVAGNPLFADLIAQHGPSVFSRELARLVRPAKMIPAMETWLSEITPEGNFYISPGKIEQGQGFGLTEVTRGALGHWVRIAKGVIEHYQIITPTAWNASPKDSAGIRGPMEEALVGTEIRDKSNPVELGIIVRSFDACLVCTVH